MGNCNMFRVLPSGHESMCCNFCTGCHARKNTICPYKYCMPVAVCANCKTNPQYLALKKKDAHEHCRVASAEYHRKQQAREDMKEKGVICSAIADLHNDSVVVYTTLGLYYRIIGRDNYQYERNSEERGTIDGLRASGVTVLNARKEEFDLAVAS